MTENFEAIIGLEVHVQLRTDSKIFASSATVAGEKPNTLTDPVTLGLPGALPVLNKRAVDCAIKLGLATNCKIQRENVFARKHYLYPDLPKGYQISQYDKPICLAGHVVSKLNEDEFTVRLTRIHLEEDAGKLVHHDGERVSSVDLNRAGVPLLEVVSEPDLRHAEQAGAFMKQLRQIVCYLDVSDGNMEEGSLRCDANVSVRPVGTEAFGTKVEIKNLNSFKHVEKAIEYEIHRQEALVRDGGEVVQETRLWDEARGETKSMRSKEYAEDYRYFPDPDLPPLVIEQDWIERIRATLPELPDDVRSRFQSMYNFDSETTEVLTNERLVARYFEDAIANHDNPSALANWITTELFGRLNKEGKPFEENPISPENIACLVRLIDEEVISGKIAKTVFDEMFSTGTQPEAIVEKKGLKQLTDPDAIRTVVKRILDANPEQAQNYRDGKTKVFGFFVGQVMKETQGKANPKLVNEILTEELG